MPRLGLYEAEVVVDGKALPEYSIVANEEKGEVICYIPSEGGKVKGKQLHRRCIY
jgi:hypothetical protein